MCFDSRPLTIASATFAAAWKSVSSADSTSFHAEYDESAARVGEGEVARGCGFGGGAAHDSVQRG